jgi:hypothetical protein
MKTVIIKYFNTKQQHRIAFIRLLMEYNNFGLKNAKDKLDSMLFDDKPIIFEIDEIKLDSFINELIKLDLEYEIK